MATTPPLQLLSTPDTPLAPLHRSSYERKPTRQSSRIRQRAPVAAPVTTTTAATVSTSTVERYMTLAPAPADSTTLRTTPEAVSTPKPKHRQTLTPRKAVPATLTAAAAALSANTAPQSPPQSTPRRASRRIHVIPPSPIDNTDLSSPPSKQSKGPRSNLLFSNHSTVMAEGMLPTPVKTPTKKKDAAVAHAAAAAAAGGRALFQDNSTLKLEGAGNDGITFATSSPRRVRKKNMRYNGFSLEPVGSAATGEQDGKKSTAGGIQIFTDNRDKVPELDSGRSHNPFLDQPESSSQSATRKPAVSGAGTRRTRAKTRERKLDSQVEEAIRKDEGMVYVFRGKKVYKRFDDSFEEEEVIDEHDLGLLEPVEDHQVEGQDGAVRPKTLKTLTRKSIKPTRLFQQEVQRRARERANEEEEAATDIEQDLVASDEAEDEPGTGSKSAPVGAGAGAGAAGSDGGESKSTKVSPFATWPRVKPGSGTRSVSAAKKRSAHEAELSGDSAPSPPSLAKHRKTRAAATATTTAA